MVKSQSKVAALREESAGLTKDAAAKAQAELEASSSKNSFELRSDLPTEELEKLVARALKAQNPELQFNEDPSTSPAGLAAAFLAYSADLAQPASVQAWTTVLQETLDDAGISLDDESAAEGVRSLIAELVKKGVIAPPTARIEEGALVVAVLSEDEDWHEALVTQQLADDKFQLLFLKYGKPQETNLSDIRPIDLAIDDEGTDGDLQEGKCEVCTRQRLLTFHHLIPKDVHPTYLKRRLPPGIEGEPSRSFLNSYGTMVCRHCHSYIHRLAPNDILAKEFNTLQKILDHPKVQTWVTWASQQTGGR